jgi:DNA-binding CsgD family transcriptional regulator
MAGRTDTGEGGAGEIVGRARPLDAIEAFLDPRAWPRALVLEGSPGIGKTTLWQWAVERAAERGIGVLTCRPVEAEASLSFGALVDLFETVSDDLLAQLPNAQARALAAALRRRLPDGPLPDPLAVSAGARSALERHATTRPVLVAIDDVQWLDPSSAAVLAYVVRRLAGMPVGVLITQRAAGADGEPLPVEDRLAVERLTIPPLSLSSLHHVIRGRTGLVLPRPLLHRIADVSEGNPLFAIGLAEAIRDGDGPPAPGDPFPAPGSLVDLVARRVADLVPGDREVLLSVATLAAPTVALVSAAIGTDPRPALEHARAAGILDAGDDPLRFVHPLYAQCVLRIVGDEARRAMHGRIATVVTELEERARHLALASTPPDEAVAGALESGASVARAHGALRSAAALLDEARRFTPPSASATAHRRAFDAAELAILAGDRGLARTLLAPVVEAADEPTRSRAIGLYAELLANSGSADEAEILLRDAVAGDPDPEALARLHLDLAYVALTRLDPRDAMASTAHATSAARAAGDTGILSEALAYDALARTLAGRDVEPVVLDEALRLEDPSRPPYMGLPPSGIAGLVHAFTADHTTARQMLESAGAALDAMGDDCDLAHVLLWSGWLAMRDGRLADAATLAHDAATTAESTGSPLLRAWAMALAALTAAARGDAVATATAVADAMREPLGGEGIVGAWLAAATGLASLATGDPAAAAASLGPLGEVAGAAGFDEPVMAFFVPDAAEALARAGDPAGADRVLRPFETAASDRARGWAVAAAMRARAEILAAEGRPADALALLRPFEDIPGSDALPLERARTLLARGRLERRLGERRSARATLDAAATAFREAGADGWAALVAAEVRRIPGRRTGDDAITASERRVAELSGAGRTNREVAAALFLSPKTVEANLARIYRKLGITTRAELGAWLARGAGDGESVDEDAIA